jgi:hypothetical protein
MPHSTYPATVDLAAYLTGSGLFPSVPITSGATGTTHAVASSSRMRIGDQLYFPSAGLLRSVTALPTSSTVTVGGASFTTLTGERVTIFPLAVDLATALGVGIEGFEDATGRKFLGSAQTRVFDLPPGSHGMIDLRADLADLDSVTVAGTLLVANDDYRPLPEDADEEGIPWTHLQLGRPYGPWPYWSAARKVSVVGTWGYSVAAIPDGAWSGMLVGAVLFGIPQLAAARTRGVISWGEADVNENYGQTPLSGLNSLWQTQFDMLAHRYDRKTVG